MAEAMVQMNTRIGSELKARGDKVLERLGYTPSVAVRALWQFIVAHEHDPAKVAEVLNAGSPASDDYLQTPEYRAKKEALEEGWRICDSLQEKLGWQGVNSLASLPYHELRELYLLERLEEKDARSVHTS